MSKIWGKVLIALLVLLYGFGLYSAYSGAFLPPLQRETKNIRQNSKHYGQTRHHGFFFGGGFGSGK